MRITEERNSVREREERRETERDRETEREREREREREKERHMDDVFAKSIKITTQESSQISPV